MSAFKPSNNLLTDTILFEAIAQIREKSDYRREVESYVLEQNGLASVRQLSEDKKRLFTRIVDAIIAEGVDEIDPSMYVMNEAYDKAIREATPDERRFNRRANAYVERAGRMAAKTDPRTGGQKPGMDISRDLKKNQDHLDKMYTKVGDQEKIHQVMQRAGERRQQIRAIQHATTKQQQDEDHSPLDPSDYRTPRTEKERNQLKSSRALHNALTKSGSVLDRHKKGVEEDVMGDLKRTMTNKVPTGQTRRALRQVPGAMADVGRQAVRGAGSMAKDVARKVGDIGYEATKKAITTIGGGVAGAVRGKPVGPRRLGEGYHKMHEDDLQELSPELLKRAATEQGRRRYVKDKRGNLPSYKATDAMTDRMEKFEKASREAERRDELHDMTPRMRELYRRQAGRVPAGTDMKRPATKPEKK